MGAIFSIFVLLIIWRVLKTKINSPEGSSPYKKVAKSRAVSQNTAYQSNQIRSAKDPHDNTHKHDGEDHAQTVFAGNSYKDELHNGKPAHALMEDRNNDWLAKQLREERGSLYRLKVMFGQQLERKSSLDSNF